MSENSKRLKSTAGTSVVYLRIPDTPTQHLYIDTENLVDDIYIGSGWVSPDDDTVDDMITLLQYRQAYRKQEGLYVSHRKLPNTPS